MANREVSINLLKLNNSDLEDDALFQACLLHLGGCNLEFCFCPLSSKRFVNAAQTAGSK